MVFGSHRVTIELAVHPVLRAQAKVSAAELIARVQALIRRSQSMTHSQMTLEPLTLDTGTQEAQLHKTPLHLTRREWHLIEALMLAAPKVIAKEKLADSLSQWDKEISINAIEIYISRLRNKFQSSGIEIRTLRGVGYRLEVKT